jgi:hypothetical protein
MAGGILDDQGKLVAACRSRRPPIGSRKLAGAAARDAAQISAALGHRG